MYIYIVNSEVKKIKSQTQKPWTYLFLNTDFPIPEQSTFNSVADSFVNYAYSSRQHPSNSLLKAESYEDLPLHLFSSTLPTHVLLIFWFVNFSSVNH
jgi:hypothetical protein